jgi:TRAP-type C4-dicarboxylate transport system substrate-binding protein
LWGQYEAKALAKMKESGIQVVTIADKKPFQDAVKPVWDKYAPQFSDTIKRIQAVQ